MIKLSFIVPVYNVAPYLRMCVSSLLSQDYKDYEIILVDDGSTDACPEICDDYERMFDNIRVIHKKNGGLSAARNSGIKIAKGEYICFVDSDDYWQPNVLKGLVEQAKRDNLDVLRFRFQNVNEEGEVFNPYKSDPAKDNDYSEVPTDGVSFLNSRMNTQCYAVMYIIKRDMIYRGQSSVVSDQFLGETNILFTEGIYFEDTDWTPRMLIRAKRVASTNTVVYNYLVREGSITNAVSRSKQKKVLDDKMRLVESMQMQSRELQEQGKDNRWFAKMIADTVISIITIIAVQFFEERVSYLKQLKELKVYPLQSQHYKARLINLSPGLAVVLLHLKNSQM